MPVPRESIHEVLQYVKENYHQPIVWGTLLLVTVVAGVVWYFANSKVHNKRKVINLDDPMPCGDITLENLKKYNGTDPFLPIYLAVRSKVYDVSKGRDFYGPGAGYSVFAGREVARALAKMSLDPADCTDDLTDVTEKQMEALRDWENKFEQKYGIVGQIVPPQELTLSELRAFDGSDPSKPIYLAIKGTIYDVTKAKQYYGPEGVYPFGGRECARALAKYSTELADCSDDLEGLGCMELDMLRDWEDRFYFKYDIVGKVKKST